MHYPRLTGNFSDPAARMLYANVSTSNFRILLPTISGIAEIDEANHLIDFIVRGAEVKEILSYEIPKLKIGLILEVPSMIVFNLFCGMYLDFISIGTNDLTPISTGG